MWSSKFYKIPHLNSTQIHLTHRNKYKNIRVSYQYVVWAGQKGRVAALTTAQAIFVLMKKRSQAAKTLRAGCSKVDLQTNKHKHTHRRAITITLPSLARSVIRLVYM